MRLEKKLPEFDVRSLDGKATATALAELDELAVALGVTPISRFLAVTPAQMAELMDVAPDDDLPEAWFDAVDGRRSVQGLLAKLRSEPSLTSAPTVRVLDDLAKIEATLLEASEQGVRFQLVMDV
jgi:hypothetical protein